MHTMLLLWMAAASAAPTEGGKVYTGPEGVEVAIVTLAPRSKNQAVLLVKGTDSELDGKALLHEVEGSGDRVDYRTQLHGRSYVTVAARSSWGGARQYILGVPGRRSDVNLVYDEKRSKELKPEEVAALWEKQNGDGSLKALQGFDRKGEEARHDKEYAEALSALGKSCGSTVTGGIEWKTVSDELLKTYSISSYCQNPLTSLERLCGFPEGKSTIQAKVKKVTCQFGKAIALDVKGGAVTFTTEKDAANQEEFATKYFEKNL